MKERKAINNIKLGFFVVAGLAFLVLLLYMIGRDQSMFGSNYKLRARFDHVQGLVSGNNVRYAGIEAGTVKKVSILNDTVIEVTMLIEKRMLSIIRKNALASIGTEGLVGNKVVNIMPAHEPADFAVEGDILPTRKSVSTDDMLNTLQETNNDIAFIARELKTTVTRINSSSALWNMLSDPGIPNDIRSSVHQIRQATGKANLMVNDLHDLVRDVKDGKGSVGTLLTDTAFAYNLNQLMMQYQQVGVQADSLAKEMQAMVASIRQDIDKGPGPVHSLLKDKSISDKLQQSLDNIQKGTDGFNQNMEALKHNFLFRGYFRKLEKKQKKAAAENAAAP